MPELRELSLGGCEGLSRAEIKARFHDFYVQRKKDKFNVPYPNGESYKTAQQRVMPFLEDIKKRGKNETILIVGHEGINRTIIGTLVGLSEEELPAIDCPHNCIYFVDLDGNKISFLLHGEEKEGYLKRN